MWEVTLLGFFIAQNHVVFDVDFWPFWARFWVPLGTHFRSCWRLGRPKLVPKPSSNRIIIQKVIFHETSAGVMFGAFPGLQESTQNDPRSPQDGSKIVLDRFFSLLHFRFVFASFWGRFWCRFELPRGPQGSARTCGLALAGVQDRPQTAPRLSKIAPKLAKIPQVLPRPPFFRFRDAFFPFRDAFFSSGSKKLVWLGI